VCKVFVVDVDADAAAEGVRRDAPGAAACGGSWTGLQVQRRIARELGWWGRHLRAHLASAILVARRRSRGGDPTYSSRRASCEHASTALMSWPVIVAHARLMVRTRPVAGAGPSERVACLPWPARTGALIRQRAAAPGEVQAAFRGCDRFSGGKLTPADVAEAALATSCRGSLPPTASRARTHHLEAEAAGRAHGSRHRAALAAKCTADHDAGQCPSASARSSFSRARSAEVVRSRIDVDERR
jgi:hypothetical protein